MGTLMTADRSTRDHGFIDSRHYTLLENNLFGDPVSPHRTDTVNPSHISNHENGSISETLICNENADLANNLSPQQNGAIIFADILLREKSFK